MMIEESKPCKNFFGYRLTEKDKITIECPEYVYTNITNICYGEITNYTESNDVFLDFYSNYSENENNESKEEIKTIKLTKLIPNSFEHVSVSNVFSHTNHQLILYTHGPNPVYISGYFEPILQFEVDAEEDFLYSCEEDMGLDIIAQEEEEILTEEQKKLQEDDRKEEEVTKSLMQYVENKRVAEEAKK